MLKHQNFLVRSQGSPSIPPIKTNCYSCVQSTEAAELSGMFTLQLSPLILLSRTQVRRSVPHISWVAPTCKTQMFDFDHVVVGFFVFCCWVVSFFKIFIL